MLLLSLQRRERRDSDSNADSFYTDTLAGCSNTILAPLQSGGPRIRTLTPFRTAVFKTVAIPFCQSTRVGNEGIEPSTHGPKPHVIPFHQFPVKREKGPTASTQESVGVTSLVCLTTNFSRASPGDRTPLICLEGRDIATMLVRQKDQGSPLQSDSLDLAPPERFELPKSG